MKLVDIIEVTVIQRIVPHQSIQATKLGTDDPQYLSKHIIIIIYTPHKYL